MHEHLYVYSMFVYCGYKVLRSILYISYIHIIIITSYYTIQYNTTTLSVEPNETVNTDCALK